jgi:hypothetical protein
MQSEREKAEKLLYNILPREIADNLKNDFSLFNKKEKERENGIQFIYLKYFFGSRGG